MRSKRKRVARKNSDSGVSVGSSVGLNTSETSSDKDSSCAKVTVNQLDWELVPVVQLQDVSKEQDVVSSKYGVCITNMSPENTVKAEPTMEPFDFSKITITTSKTGRTVNGQLLVVPPSEPKFEMSFDFNSDDENDVKYSPSDVEQKYHFMWNRGDPYYNLPEVTSHSIVFEGATLAEPFESGEFHFGSERSSSRCSSLSAPEEHIRASPLLARRTVFINQKHITSPEKSKVVSPILARKEKFLEPKHTLEENKIDSPLLDCGVTRIGKKRALSPAESRPSRILENFSGLSREHSKEPSRTPSQERLKRLRLEMNSSMTESQNKKTPPVSEAPNISRVSPSSQEWKLGRPEKSVRVLDSTIIREPFKRKPVDTFKIPRLKEAKSSAPRSSNSPQNSQMEDDAISLFVSSELKNEVENDLQVTPLPVPPSARQSPKRNRSPLLSPPPVHKHSPIQLGARWSPPPAVACEHDVNEWREPFRNGFESVPVNNPVPQTPPPLIPKEFNRTQPPPPLPFTTFTSNYQTQPPPLMQHTFNSPIPSFSNNIGPNKTEQIEKNARNNKSQIVLMTHRFCRRMKGCSMSYCKFSHDIPEHYRQVLFESDINCVKTVAKYLLNHCNSYTVNNIIPMVISYYSSKQDSNSILNLMTMIFQKQNLNLNKKWYMQQIINAIISNDEGTTVEDAIDEIILYNGIKGSEILDTLLEVIPLQEGFLTKYWNQIWKMIKYRKTPVPFQLVDDFIEECVNLDHYNEDVKEECYHNLCKFLTYSTFEVKHVNKRKVQSLLMKMKNMNLYECVSSLQDIFVKAGSPLIEFSNIINDSLLEFACEMPAEKISSLQIHISDKNINEIAFIIREYSYAPSAIFKAFSLVHNSKVMTATELVMLFQELVDCLDYPRAEGNLKVTIETIGFNLIPLYDFEKDYYNACIILKMFMSNIKSFLTVKNYSTVHLYKENLKNDPEKIVLFIKILTRASYLSDAFSFIKMPEFDLFNKNTVRSLYNYKMDIIHKFISRAMATDLNLSWKILEYLLKTDIEVAKSCHITDHYSSYLRQHLQSVDAQAVADEFYNSIKFYYEYINVDVLRAIVANLSTVIPPIELKLIYDYCCSKSIYITHTGTENTITLRQNLTVPEIKMVFKMFFLKMLTSNLAATELKIRLTEVIKTKGVSMQLGIFKHPEKCDNLAMMLRLSSALFTFQPPICMDDHPEKLPVEVVMRCLEITRRNL